MTGRIIKARRLLGIWATATVRRSQNVLDASTADSRQYWDLGSSRYHVIRPRDLPDRDQEPE